MLATAFLSDGLALLAIAVLEANVADIEGCKYRYMVAELG